MGKTNHPLHRLEEYVPDSNIGIEEYESYIGSERVGELKRLAEPLEGKGWANVNSTLMGGGVAEMLRSVIPLARGLGIKASWSVIEGEDDFFMNAFSISYRLIKAALSIKGSVIHLLSIRAPIGVFVSSRTWSRVVAPS